ncbi:hypothetical protein QBC41DRAFT_308525 [Cercophora samala]|uniref:Uncharacterized protein n=1 Tax=Cercophora samala TaxID=330535 RepID=A0AA39YIK4_9PEZI|nr:hypothetical protein QBC41DRAFT_308525 [Cercophora samala]
MAIERAAAGSDHSDAPGSNREHPIDLDNDSDNDSHNDSHNDSDDDSHSDSDNDSDAQADGVGDIVPFATNAPVQANAPPAPIVPFHRLEIAPYLSGMTECVRQALEPGCLVHIRGEALKLVPGNMPEPYRILLGNI